MSREISFVVPHKNPMGQGQFGPHRLQSLLLILFSPYAFAPLRQCLRRADFNPRQRKSSTRTSSGWITFPSPPSGKTLLFCLGTLPRPLTTPHLSQSTTSFHPSETMIRYHLRISSMPTGWRQRMSTTYRSTSSLKICTWLSACAWNRQPRLTVSPSLIV